MSGSTAHCTNICANGLAAHQGDSTMAEVRIVPTCPIPVFGRRSSPRIGSAALEVRGRPGRRTCGLLWDFDAFSYLARFTARAGVWKAIAFASALTLRSGTS